MVRRKQNAICLMLALLLLGMLVFVMPAPAYAATSSFSLTGETYPTSLTKGQSFGLNGTIKSTVTIDRVTIGVYDEDAGSWVDSATHREYSLGTKTYDIGKADPYIKFGTLPVGNYTYRVWVKDTNGTSKYLLKKAFTVKSSTSSTSTATSSSSFSITGANYPTTLIKGKSFSITGTVKSYYKIDRVTVGVYHEDKGEWVSTAVHRVYNLGAKTYSISDADDYIKFGSLPVGNYTYRVWVKDVKGASKYVLKKAFTVKSSTGSTSTTTSSSSFSVTGANYPTTLTKGSSFSIKGTIKSALKINRVTIGVYNEETGKWVDGAVFRKYNLGVKTYDINKADESIKFGTLGAGSYTYRVWVKDVNGTSKYVLKKPFTVTTASSFSTTGVKYPGTLTAGSSFSLVGTIKSANTITAIRVGITNANGYWVKGAFVDKEPGKKTFDLASVDESIKFGSLKAGTYHLCVKVTDAAGTTKKVINKAFTVSDEEESVQAAVLLPYKSSLIKSIGKQPYSGPCGIYSMAYARAVIDGKFPLGKYSSYKEKIIAEYGHGSSYAYWSEAGGTLIMFSTVSSMYRKAFDQLDNGKPCIINCYNPSTGNNHFVLAIGYVDGTTRSTVKLKSFIVLDPATGTKRNMADTKYETPEKSPYGPELIIF
ncbi:MAG: hypothetical protein II682_06290 [Firmicutes bacterium]|nr:hypothetical protein [Bacillota bacterium]